MTEPQYVKGFSRAQRNNAVKVAVRTLGRSPSELIRYARKLRDRDSEDFDEVWCVFDVDDFPDIERACAEARRSGVRVAVSNPCFELWLLLHHRPYQAEISTSAVRRLLEKHVPGYCKSELDFGAYAAGLDGACERAESLDPTGTSHTLNPSTAMWMLADRIRRRPV